MTAIDVSQCLIDSWRTSCECDYAEFLTGLWFECHFFQPDYFQFYIFGVFILIFVIYVAWKLKKIEDKINKGHPKGKSK